MSWNACVVRIHKKGKTETFLVDADKITIGRSPDCDFVIADSQVSRQHLGILIRNGQAFVKDLGSANGSFLGKEQIPEDRVIAYRPGEDIVFGSTNIHITLEVLSKKVDVKLLKEEGVPKEEAEKIISILDTAKTRAKNLHNDYERLIADAKALMQAEAQMVHEEAKKKSAEIISQAEQSAKRVLEAATTAESEAIARAKKVEADVVSVSQKKAEQEVARIHTEAQMKKQSAAEEAQQILQEAQKKAQTIAEDAQKNSLVAIQEAQRKSQENVLSAQTQAQILNEEAQKNLQEAQKKALELVQSAQLKSQEISQETQRKAQAMIEEAEQKAHNANADVLRKAQEARVEAQAAAQELTLKAKFSAEEIVKQAEHYFATKKKEAESSAQKILHDVQVQVDRLYADFDNKKKDEFGRMQKETDVIRSKLQQEHQTTIQRLESDFELKTKMFEEECAIRRRQLEKELQMEQERVEDTRKFQSTLQAELERTQVELRKTQAELKSEQVKFHSFQNELVEAHKKHDEFSAQAKELELQHAHYTDDLARVIREKEEALHQIQVQKKRFEEERSQFDKMAYDQKLKVQVDLNDLRQKESADIQKMRLEELEKIDLLRRKTLEEIVKNKDVFKLRLSEKVEARIVALMKSKNQDFDLPTFHKEVYSLVQSATEEQSFELTQGHEADIKTLVAEEQTKRKTGIKKFLVGATGAAALAIGIFISQGGNIESLILGKNSQGETAVEEFSRVQREKAAAKKFEPPQSDYIKSSYTDNVLYTRNYIQVYSDPKFQERWIHEVNKMFSKEFELEDDAIVKFVAIESALISRLQQERTQIVPDYAQLGIDKMRKVEKESVDEMKQLIKEPSRMRKFQAFSEKFWFDRLEERKPASGN